MSNITKVILPLAIVGLLSGCSSIDGKPEEIATLQKKLGTGWRCPTVPDGLIKAGVVTELTSDGKIFFHEDFSDRSKEKPSIIGSTTYTSESTYGGVLQLLKEFEVIDAGASTTAKLDRTVQNKVTYSETKKHYISGSTVEYIVDIYKRKNLNPNSRYIILRESHSASGLSILLKKDVVWELGSKSSIEEIVSINPSFSNASKDEYKIEKALQAPIGVCAIGEELRIKRGIDGVQTVTIKEGSEVLPNEFRIER